MRRRTFLKGMGIATGMAVFKGWGREALAADESGQARIVFENFPLHKQETPYTCGPASLRMVLEYLGHPLSEAEIAKKMGTKPKVGTSFWQMNRACNFYLKKFNTGLKARDKIGKAANDRLIFESIDRDRPVIFTWIAENHFDPGKLVGHYSVAIGFDKTRREFTIANPFGKIHPVDFDRFWRLCAWNPAAGDIPNVKSKKRILRLPPDLVILQ